MPGFSIRNPYFILVCALILCVIGATAVARMPVDMFPVIDQTIVVVATFYPGMPPEQIENDLTSRMERFLTLAPGIDYMESRSLPGVSIIRVAFQRGTNPDTATAAIVNLAAVEQRRLPPGTIPSLVVRADASSLPVCLVALKGEGMTEATLRDITHYKVRTQLAKLPGAAVPPPFGGKYRQIMVYVDPQRLQGVDVSPMDVVRAINAANVILPSGTSALDRWTIRSIRTASSATCREFCTYRPRGRRLSADDRGRRRGKGRRADSIQRRARGRPTLGLPTRAAAERGHEHDRGGRWNQERVERPAGRAEGSSRRSSSTSPYS